MKNSTFLSIILLLLIVFSGCSREEESFIEQAETSIAEPSNDIAEIYSTLRTLPKHIQEEFGKNSTALKEASKVRKGKTEEFGELLPEKVIVSESENGSSTYSIALEKIEGGFYYDNMALKELPDGSTSLTIFRFRPNEEWYASSFGKENRYSNYSGSIEVFDRLGTSKIVFTMENGQAVDTWEDTTTRQCVSTAVIAIGCAYSCWVSDIKVTEACTGGGGTGGSGFGSGSGPSGDGNIGGSTGGGSNGGSGNNGDASDGSPTDVNVTPVDNLDIVYPSCESFEYTNLGSTGVQVAAVNGIWDVVIKTDRCPGIGVAAAYQTYYFQIPSWNGPSRGATKSADALEQWFRRQGCSKMSTGVLARKMDEFIIDEFKNIGGTATRTAPRGWNGRAVPYQENWTGRDFCN